LSSFICDEFIQLLGEQVLQTIVNEVKVAKYYSISVDSTPDLSNTDQLTFIIRYVLPQGPVERFIKFIPIRQHSGQALAEVILQTLQEHGLSFDECRGQSYDNAANMSGVYNGVQALLRKENELADYIPCCGHSLNLVGKCAVDCCPLAVYFFDFVQNLYTFFAASTSRWSLLIDAIRPLGLPTLKRLSDTRWSAHWEAINALQRGYDHIRMALQSLNRDISQTVETRLVATGLEKQMNTLETGVMVSLWNRILQRFDKTSKTLQASNIHLNTATSLLKSLLDFVQSLREVFQDCEEEGKAYSKCEVYKVERSRNKRRPTQADDGDGEDALTSLSPSHCFKVTVFYVVIDKLVSALHHRLSAYENVSNRFGFLADVDTLSHDQLRTGAKKLVDSYPTDIEESFEDEIVHFAEMCKTVGFGTVATSKELAMWTIISEMSICSAFPNTAIALRIYLCMMISNCSGERSFSTLKRIKNNLRATIRQPRLNALSLLCIENDILSTIDTDKVIRNFAAQKSRKVQFQ
jgi:hypothetical protein